MEFTKEENRIYLADTSGEVIAEIDFPFVEEGVVDINHTYVSGVLRGQGIAGKLMEAAVAQIREKGWRAYTSCSYAAGWMAKHPDQVDLLA